MNTRSTNSTLKHLGIFNRVAQRSIIAGLSIAKFWGTFYRIRQIHLHALWQTVGNSLTQSIDNTQGHFLHTRHIFNRVLGSHRGIGNDVGTVLMTILIFHPFQHASTTIVIKVGIDIGQRDTVWIQETLKQQVVFQWVNLRDT